MIRRDLHQRNRASWDAATPAHSRHKRDQAGFLRAGGTTLFPEEVELLLGTGPEGPALADILAAGARPLAGRRLLHLQCNAGQDTLSLAALGAEVTGVDISPVAVAEADALSTASGLPGRFVCADVYDYLPAAAAAGERFDLVFVSYGALLWLSDLDVWAAGIAAVLAPGGRQVGLEFHPFARMLDERGRFAYPYASGAEVTAAEGVSDYVGASGEALAPSGFVGGGETFTNPHATHEFSWGVGDLVSALLRAGLALTELREYPYSNGCRLLQDLVETTGRRFVPPPGGALPPDLPLMLGWSARRP